MKRKHRDLIEILRQAGTSRAAVLHEFWTQCRPGRIHVFVEGEQEKQFYSSILKRYVRSGQRLYFYRCGRKAAVFEVYNAITSRLPEDRSCMYFVNKEIDDLVGAPWPKAPHIFTTKYFSCLNYLIEVECFLQFWQSAVPSGCSDIEGLEVGACLADLLKSFHLKMLTMVAFAMAASRRGRYVDWGKFCLQDVFDLTSDCRLSCRKGSRRQLLDEAVAPGAPVSIRELLGARRELARLPAKHVVSGSAEAWLVLRFWASINREMQHISRETGEIVQFRESLDEARITKKFVELMDVPDDIDVFIKAQLTWCGLMTTPSIGAGDTEEEGEVFWLMRMFGGVIERYRRLRR